MWPMDHLTDSVAQLDAIRHKCLQNFKVQCQEEFSKSILTSSVLDLTVSMPCKNFSRRYFLTFFSLIFPRKQKDDEPDKI